MMMIAGLGVILGLNLGFGWRGNAPQLRMFNILTWLTWVIVGGIATSIVAFQSMRNLFRLHIWGSARPRWWFEIARLLWIVFLFSLLSLPILFILNFAGMPNGIIDATPILFFALIYSFFGFFATASLGYIVSVVRQRPCRGRAFECVHYFYVIVGGIGLLNIAVFHWPPKNVWPAGFTLTLLFVVGLAILAGGFLSIIHRYEKNEKNRKEKMKR